MTVQSIHKPTTHSGSNKVAIVIGATGLVGKYLVDELLASGHYQKIYQVIRRQQNQTAHQSDASDHNPKTSALTTIVVPDFAQLGLALAALDLNQADAFCTLGTTLKQAGSKQAFKQVDLDYSLSFAQTVKELGASHFLLLTATGADAHSLFFYNKIKGQLEQAVTQLGFSRLSIFQPSLLIGQHQDKRLIESLAQKAFGLTKPLLPETWSYRPIEATRVAKAMQKVATTAHLTNNNTIYSNSDLLNLTLENPA